MVSGTSNIYQFKITLKHINPKIWRRIQVPANYSFWDLHVAIQNAMGWYDCHLHQFMMKDPVMDLEEVIIGMEEDEEPEEEAKIAEYFLPSNKKAIYIYDFGDSWTHEIVLEKVLPAGKVKYPLCVGGERACPPEDCGGSWGYGATLEAIKNPKDPKHRERLEWLDEDFDPERFDPESVVFEDPEEYKADRLAFK